MPLVDIPLAQIKEKFVYLVKSRFLKRCQSSLVDEEEEEVDPFTLPAIDLQRKLTLQYS